MDADERWLPVEEVWPENGQGESMSEGLLSMHCGAGMSRSEAGIGFEESSIEIGFPSF